jgi:LPS O-antigen subunit length determinant protein (WzzB/FepE family)
VDKKCQTEAPGRNVQYVPVQMMPGYDNDDEIDLLELWNILWRGKWLVIGFSAVCTLAAVIAVLFVLTPKYKAEAVLRATELSQPIIEGYLNSANFKEQLVQKFDLLSVLYPDKWDAETKSWKTISPKEIPTVRQAIAGGDFPLASSVDKKSKLVTVTWDARDPEQAATLLQGSLDLLSSYMADKYVTDAQTQISILEKELGPLTSQFDSVWEKFWQLDKVSIASTEFLRGYTDLKSKLSDLKAADALARKFDILSSPIPPYKPFKPKKALIVALAAVGSGFLGVLIVFVREAMRKVKQGKEAS